MPVINEPNRLGDWLKYEEDNLYSREQVIVAMGQDLRTGSVVGKFTNGGRIAQLNPGANDGTQNAVGVLITDVKAGPFETPGVIIARHAVCSDKALIWPTGITGPQKTAAIAQLQQLGILVREGA
jgi:hypothetical protein